MASTKQSLNDMFIDLSSNMGILQKQASVRSGEYAATIRKNVDSIRSAYSTLLRDDVSELMALTITFVPNLISDIGSMSFSEGSYRTSKDKVLATAKLISHALPKYIDELRERQPQSNQQQHNELQQIMAELTLLRKDMATLTQLMIRVLDQVGHSNN